MPDKTAVLAAIDTLRGGGVPLAIGKRQAVDAGLNLAVGNFDDFRGNGAMFSVDMGHFAGSRLEAMADVVPFAGVPAENSAVRSRQKIAGGRHGESVDIVILQAGVDLGPLSPPSLEVNTPPKRLSFKTPT